MQTIATTAWTRMEHLDPAFATDLIIPNGASVDIGEGDTGFGFAAGGQFTIKLRDREVVGHPNMFYSVPGPARIDHLHGMVCIRHGYVGLLLLGMVEHHGRLRYIDGCSDTLLLAPVKMGDPCVNYLNVPPGVDQADHTHPSVRIGLIMAGKGICVTPTGDHEMAEGAVFILPPNEIHSFHTTDKRLEIVVYHPESDFGPTEEDHPMINRTFITSPSHAMEIAEAAPS